MKKIIISIILTALVLSGFAQMNTFGGIGLRVNDTTTYQTNAVAYHSAGYRDMYFNNQATNKHFDIWNGSSYQHVFTFGGGSGGSGTVTNVSALTLGTTGTDLSSSVANGTTTPVITLNVPTASASNRGALSSTDWTSFNGKQAALVSGTNIKTVAGYSLVGSGNVALQRQAIGDIYSENFATGGTLGSYTNVGSGTASTSGTALNISGGTAGTTSNYVHRNLTSSITNFYRHVIFSPTANSTGETIGIGVVSRSSVSPHTVYATFCPAASTNRGQLKIHAINSVGTNTVVATSTTNLSYTNGDLLDFVYTYGGTGNSYVTIKNLTNTSASPIHVEYVSPNTLAGPNGTTATYSPCFYPLGATWSVYLDVYGTKDSYGPLLVRIGDSITAGNLSGSPNQSEVGYISSQLGDGDVVTFACGGNTAQNLYNSISQVLVYAPKYAALMVGANDIGQSVPLGTITTPNTYLYFVEQIVQTLLANDIIPIICYITPTSAGGQTTVNTWNAALLSNFSGRCQVLDWSTQLISGGVLSSLYDAGDALHINTLGHILMSQYFIEHTPLNWYQKPTTGYFSNGVRSTTGTFSGAVSGSSTASFTTSLDVGTTNKLVITPDFAGFGSLPAGSVLVSGGNAGGVQMITSGTGTAGVSGGHHYYDGSAFRATWKVANVSSGFGSLQLMPAGGKVGVVNSSPSEALDVTGNVRFSGALMPNNTAGTSGQVLTSAGAGTVPTWTNSGSRTLNVNTSQVALSTTSETDLYRYSVPASTLSINGNSIEADFSGIYSNSGNTKVVRVYFGATKIFDSGNLTNSTGTNHWKLSVQVIMVNGTNQKCNVVLSSSAGVSIPLLVSYLATTETLTGALDLAVTGQASAASPEITKETGKTILVQ